MKKNKNGEIARMFKFAGNYHKFTVLACILSAISTVLSIIPFVCIWFVIRNICAGMINGYINQSLKSSTYAWMAFAFSAASILLYFLALIFSHIAAFRTAKNMKKKAMHHIVELPLGYFNMNASGKIRKIIDDNAGLTEGFLAHQLPDLTGAIVMPIVTLVLLFVFDWKLGICCLIPLGISVIFLKQMIGGENAEFMSKYMTALENMNKEAVEYIRGIPVVKVFQQTIYSFKNFHAAIEEYNKFASGYAIKCRVPLTSFTVTLNMTFLLLIPLGMIIIRGASDNISCMNIFLDFLFYSLFAPVCTIMMNRIMFASEQLMAAKAAITRIEQILSEKVLPEPKQSDSICDNSIEFKNVSFIYPGANKKSLNNISFFVPEGKTVALVGASGGGKSTAASLIPRFYDTSEGSVYIGGADVKNLLKQDLMDRISFVFQNTNLFKESILDNIREAKPSASLEEVQNAIELCQCKEIIDRLPNGINTIVGSGGTYLSGGESQRIALARAVLKDAPIIILDEATAFADAENENKIQLALEKLTKGKTVIMIAHRLSTIQNADQIFVFRDGEIIEHGTHKELLNQHKVYDSMWNDYQSSISWKVSKEDYDDRIVAR
ncbi:ABC transporter ATP-binding protein [Clostridium sp. ZBS2]|uniref:ABC transporter ATP-binding protein n=1 Tax=Clostridium sp. ZBS2 TaxID=2949976 RepID=UPI00207A5DD3|nr:ABC transporter ATP-binding protein [Clostridium sp. ZBS2]